jgi:hypothetical protein
LSVEGASTIIHPSTAGHGKWRMIRVLRETRTTSYVVGRLLFWYQSWQWLRLQL